MGVCSGESIVLWQHLDVLSRDLTCMPLGLHLSMPSSCFTHSLWELSDSRYFSTTSGTYSGHRALLILVFLFGHSPLC